MTNNEGREFVHEVKQGNVILEIYEKVDSRTGKIYFDYRTGHEFFVGDDDTTRSPFCQQRDLRDNIRALIDAQEWVSAQHRAIREGNY